MIEIVIEQRRRSLGGFEVGRVLPFIDRRMVGPFIFFDHMGPIEVGRGIPREMDVRPHPHIGLSTLTYLFEGEITHRDSLGTKQVIRPGEVNWMTAGRGITHSERFEGLRANGGRLHGIQSWIALPERDQECAPDFFHCDAKDLPKFEAPGRAATLVAGEAWGRRSPVPVFSRLLYIDLRLAPGARMDVPGGYRERAAYVVSGQIEIAGSRYATGQMPVFAADSAIAVTAVAPSVVMLIGGDPIGQRFIDWNFVSSSKERIAQARADWQAGNMPLPQDDSAEFIPYPS
jgi:redox-sensitive bicupin YhaK (pirin superfamily)